MSKKRIHYQKASNDIADWKWEKKRVTTRRVATTEELQKICAMENEKKENAIRKRNLKEKMKRNPNASAIVRGDVHRRTTACRL